MKTTKLLSTALAGLLACAPTLHAAVTYETIVKWGEDNGDTSIVTANAAGVNQFGTTYDESSIGSPSNGTSGYADPEVDQTRTFYGAMSISNGVPIINDNGGGDRIQMVNNFGGSPGSLTSMVAWQAGDFLNSQPGPVLESLNVEYASRGGDGSTVQFLIETADGWYRSDQSDTNLTSTLTNFSANIADLTWAGFSEFGVDAGAGTTPDTAGIQSVGLYFSSTNTSANFIGGVVTYFEVIAAVPEPSSSALLGLGALALALRRRRA